MACDLFSNKQEFFMSIMFRIITFFFCLLEKRSYTILEPSIKHSECKYHLHILLVEWIFIQYMHYKII